ncbi:MAG: hypothetical protein R3Y27_00990 [Clostridia bacterium]
MSFSEIITELQETILLFVDYLLTILGIIEPEDPSATTSTEDDNLTV